MNSQISDFIIDQAYDDCNVLPMVYISTNRASYGLYKDHYTKYVGLHMMDTQDCIEHPDFRKNLQVIRKVFYEDMNEVPPGIKGGTIFIDSYELWKFISMYLKGEFISYELLYMPTIHCDYNASRFIDLMRQGCTNKIGKIAKNLAYKYANKEIRQEQAIMVYYRLVQAIMLLKENEFVWNIDSLFEYGSSFLPIYKGQELLFKYRRSALKNKKINTVNIKEYNKEIIKLVDEVDRAMMVTVLPDECPKDILQAILHRVKMLRLQWV